MFAASKTASVSGGYQISRSLRFNSADSAYLNRTPASAGNKQTWTLSVWVKRGSLGAFNPIYSAGATSPRAYIIFNSSDKMDFRSVDSGNTEVIRLTTTQVFRDPSAWYHIVVAQDTTQATSSNRVKIYVNGTQITAFDTATYPSQNISNLAINDALEQNYGRYVNSPSDGYLSAYLTETNFIDGSQLTPSSFGETNAQTGVWQPKAYSGSYGTNGFYLNFSDNSNTTAATLGKDYSGNGNNWTPNNFSVTAGAGNDSLVDSPTSYGTDTGVGGTVRGNYCTMNPLKNNANNVLSNGNLTVVNSASSTSLSFGTIGYPKSDKYYFEALASANAGTTAVQIGIASTNHETTNTGSKRYWYLESGGLYEDGTLLQTVSSFTAGDTIACAYNADANTVTFYKNNTQQGTAISVSTSYDYVPLLGIYKGQWDVNFGQRPFAYTAPSGYKALCTQNLPTPTIGATTATQAGLYFNPVLYTGTGANGNAITVGFQPDFTWLKGRSNVQNHGLFDAVRGAGKGLQSNSTGAEYNLTDTLNSFNANGFTVNNDSTFNGSGYTYVAWNWKANGSGSTNTAGSITSTVSANTTAGFSIVTYTGTGANATVGHGLGVAPRMIIGRSRTTSGGWPVYHASLSDPRNNYLVLNLTDAVGTASNYWGTSSPTSTTFSLSTYGGNNNTGDAFVMYCFAEVAGYSKFDSFTGNGSTDGAFVYTGFRPAFVMLKASSNGGVGYNWGMFDNDRLGYNSAQRDLRANLSDAEGTDNNIIDFLSNGFKIRSTSNGFGGGSGITYIYMAFAENPFKFSLAR